MLNALLLQCVHDRLGELHLAEGFTRGWLLLSLHQDVVLLAHLVVILLGPLQDVAWRSPPVKSM